MTPTDLGQLLRELRGDRTQEEIATLAAIPQNSISAYERGLVDVPASRLAALVAALCRTPDDHRRVGALLAGDVQPASTSSP